MVFVSAGYLMTNGTDRFSTLHGVEVAVFSTGVLAFGTRWDIPLTSWGMGPTPGNDVAFVVSVKLPLPVSLLFFDP